MKKNKIVIKEDPAVSAAGVGLIFVWIWIEMLALGALSQRLHIRQLHYLGYWDVMLIHIAFGLFRSRSITRWVVGFDK